jgi:DNA-binding MarR family transcriptional regulator
MPNRARVIEPIPEPSGVLPSLVRAYAAAVAGFEKQTGLHIARWRLLDVLRRHGEMAQHELTRHTLIDPAAVSRIVREFETSGEMSRRPDPDDHRQSLVSLTQTGIALVLRVAAARERFVTDATAGIEPADLARVETILAALRANLDRLR